MNWKVVQDNIGRVYESRDLVFIALAYVFVGIERLLDAYVKLHYLTIENSYRRSEKTDRFRIVCLVGLRTYSFAGASKRLRLRI